MRQLAEHPMDQFPVRPLQFELDSLHQPPALWSHTCPEFAMFINALALHIPHFERYLIRSMRAAKEHISDPAMRRDISAIIGQEAHHAKNFLRFNQALARRYPKVAQHDQEAADYFEKLSARQTLKQMVGYTAGYETFTFLAGVIVLRNYTRWFEDSDPTLKAMWVWHQVEEIEHGAVAFEVYQTQFGEHEWYRKWMVLKSLTHIALQTLKTYPHMARVEGWLRNPFKGAAKLGFCVLMLLRLLHAALPVFRRDYHPRKHPIATTAQDPIQIAWRRHEGAGGNVLQIDREQMAQMLGVAPPVQHGPS
jgi:predicted metal-dependent hydrolase